MSLSKATRRSGPLCHSTCGDVYLSTRRERAVFDPAGPTPSQLLTRAQPIASDRATRKASRHLRPPDKPSPPASCFLSPTCMLGDNPLSAEGADTRTASNSRLRMILNQEPMKICSQFGNAPNKVSENNTRLLPHKRWRDDQQTRRMIVPQEGSRVTR
jgi:hypothetical protein